MSPRAQLYCLPGPPPAEKPQNSSLGPGICGALPSAALDSSPRPSWVTPSRSISNFLEEQHVHRVLTRVN